jgi:hypothetical protein
LQSKGQTPSRRFSEVLIADCSGEVRHLASCDNSSAGPWMVETNYSFACMRVETRWPHSPGRTAGSPSEIGEKE